MEPMGIVQARTSERIKENAANILDKLGLKKCTPHSRYFSDELGVQKI